MRLTTLPCSCQVRVTVSPESTVAQHGGVPWWIILVAVLAGVLILALLVFLLWKVSLLGVGFLTDQSLKTCKENRALIVNCSIFFPTTRTVHLKNVSENLKPVNLGLGSGAKTLFPALVYEAASLILLSPLQQSRFPLVCFRQMKRVFLSIVECVTLNTTLPPPLPLSSVRFLQESIKRPV